MRQENYIELRRWLNHECSDAELEAYVRQPFASVLATADGTDRTQVYFRSQRVYWFYEHWSWFQLRFWDEAEREFYRSVQANRRADRQKLPAVSSAMLLCYALETHAYRKQANFAAQRLNDSFLEAQRELRRLLAKRLGLWFWQRWWGWFLPREDDLSNQRAIWVQFWRLSFLSLQQLENYQAAFIAAPSLPCASLPDSPDEEVEVNLAASAGQDALLQQLKAGKRLDQKVTTLVALYDLDLAALRTNRQTGLAQALKQVAKQRRLLWKRIHPDMNKTEFTQEAAQQLQALLSDEAVNYLQTRLVAYGSGGKLADDSWTLVDEQRWLKASKSKLNEWEASLSHASASAGRMQRAQDRMQTATAGLASAPPHTPEAENAQKEADAAIAELIAAQEEAKIISENEGQKHQQFELYYNIGASAMIKPADKALLTAGTALEEGPQVENSAEGPSATPVLAISPGGR